jgi:arylsulfatase A-like enzyme
VEKRKPNVVIFFTDQQRWDTSSLHGNPLDLMPNFDRLARAGTHLVNSFTCQPVCGPSRACLQTGLYATQTGVHINGLGLKPGLKTLADHFNVAGYHTGYFGKWHLAPKQLRVAPEYRGGYKEWLAANWTEACSDAYDCVLYDDDMKEVRLPGYRVDALTDAAIRFIDRNADRPFFLMTSYLEPHHQNNRDDYPPPDGYRERYTDRWTPPDLKALGGSSAYHLGGYYGMVKRLDEALGRVYDALKSLNLLDNTILLFTSDHGCHFRTRNDEYKRSCHESSIRVPTMFYGADFVAGGSRTELFSTVDVAPTLLDAAGLSVPDELPGHSLLPRLRGEKTTWPEEVFVQVSESECARVVRTKLWKYSVRSPFEVKWPELTDQRVHAEKYEEMYLYDLESDPYELVNLAGGVHYREVCDELQGRLQKLMAGAGEPPCEIEPAEPRELYWRRPEIVSRT